jgi:hypothetical protein
MKPFALAHAASVCMFAGIAFAGDPPVLQRAFPIERAIQQADIAIGYPTGRPESLELLRVDYVVEPLNGDQFDGILLPDKVVQQLAGKTFWVLHYRKFPIAAGGGYSVFLNGFTGEKVYVARSR